MTAPVYIVHCVDTEGPLYESLEAKFERLDDLFGITHLPPTRENYLKLRNGEIDLGGKEKEVQQVFSRHRARHNETWTEVDAMLDRVLAPAFRNRIPDSAGNGWVYSWFCRDNANFLNNPRRRDIGYHNIFDHYRRSLAENGETRPPVLALPSHVHLPGRPSLRDALSQDRRHLPDSVPQGRRARLVSLGLSRRLPGRTPGQPLVPGTMGPLRPDQHGARRQLGTGQHHRSAQRSVVRLALGAVRLVHLPPGPR